MYVFAHHTTLDPGQYDPLDVSAWQFYVLPRGVLERLGYATLSLVTVRRFAEPASFDALRAAIEDAIPAAPG